MALEDMVRLSLWFARIHLLKQLAWELPGPPPQMALGSLGASDLPGQALAGGLYKAAPPFVAGRMPFVSGMG